jgi:molybdate transport system permease protein
MGIDDMDFLPLYLSIKLAFVSTCVLITIAAPLAYVLAYSRFPGKSLLEALINLPIALPPTVVGFYLLVVMGPKGAIGRLWAAAGSPLLFTFLGIAVASIIYSFPFAIQPMKAAFEKIDRRLIESAYVLGFSRFATFIKVIIPNSVPGIAASAILVFIHSMGAFGVLLMVGGSIPGETKVASIAIYEAVEALNYREAGLMSLTLVPISYTFLLIINRFNKGKSHGT